MSGTDADFRLLWSADGEELVGARWWNDSVRAGPQFPRRDLVKLALVGGGIAGAALLFTGIAVLSGDDVDDIEVAEALELQRRDGWNVGGGSARLNLVGASPTDRDGGASWSGELPGLATALEPRPLRLRPYYVSTLFQSLVQSTLREQMKPVHAASADVTYARAAELSKLLAEGDAKDAAVILDLPGEDTVAAAAAMAEHFWPVFGFGNWPHPRGVVESHQTLGAALYYLPRFRQAAAALAPDRPPVFVLDSARLTPYTDDPNRFDNRYVAKLPTAENLQALGIRRLIYVRQAGAEAVELDDLNDEFVAFRDAGLDVRLVSLGDFQKDERSADRRYYWGGSPGAHFLFLPMYGFGPSARVGSLPRPSGVDSLPRPTSFEPRPSTQYRPTKRDTMFSSRTVGGMPGVGKQKPSGFGLVSVRGDRTVGAPGASRRSGSFGRSTSSYSG
jgi:hypothetical protein